jgi:hypothetical protein
MSRTDAGPVDLNFRIIGDTAMAPAADGDAGNEIGISRSMKRDPPLTCE